MRPKQWVKNGFVLAPLVFSGEFLNSGLVSHAVLAVLLFCLASSATHIINDMHDIEYDRRHPKSIGAFVAERLLDLVAVRALALVAWCYRLQNNRDTLRGARPLSLAVKRLAKGSLGRHAAKGM